jgi:hypothetical protein
MSKQVKPIGLDEIKELLSSIYPLLRQQVVFYLAAKIKINPIFTPNKRGLSIEKAIELAEKNVDFLARRRYIKEDNGLVFLPGTSVTDIVNKPNIIYPFYYVLSSFKESFIVGKDERNKMATDMFFLTGHKWEDILFLDEEFGDRKLYLYDALGKKTHYSHPIIITLDEDLSKYQENLMPKIKFTHIKMTDNKDNIFPDMEKFEYEGFNNFV